MSDSISPVSRTSIALVSTLSDDATDWMTANWPMPDANVAARSTATRQARDDLLERFQPFGAYAVLELNEAGGIAARPCHALDEAAADRVGDVVENDRYVARRLQQRHHPGIAGCHDHVGRQCDQLASVPMDFPSITAGPPDLHLHVSSLGPAQSLHRLLERHQALLLLGIGRRIHQHADASHPLALLRPRPMRPRRRAAEQRDELAPLV